MKHDRRRMRVAVGAAAVVLAGGAAVLAATPFHVSIAIPGPGHVEASCRAPLISAWQGGPRTLALWAVSSGDGQTFSNGYAVRSGQGPWCADEARPRLAVSGGLLLAASAAGVIGWARRRRPGGLGSDKGAVFRSDASGI
jgi:hypothetical protein